MTQVAGPLCPTLRCVCGAALQGSCVLRALKCQTNVNLRASQNRTDWASRRHWRFAFMLAVHFLSTLCRL
jgi:hypothetical protein